MTTFMARSDQPHKLTFDNFVAKCTDFLNPINAKHKDLDYSRPETRAAWNGSKSKVPIWCNVHKAFFTQMAANHMALGQGCPECGKTVFKEKRRTQDPIAGFRKVHGDFYDYSAVRYVNTHTPVEIGCLAHGPFMQKPLLHLQGHGCPSCWQNKRVAMGAARTADYTTSYAERAARIHQGKYAIAKLPKHSHDTAVLVCQKHGEFEQKAYVHLQGHGCPICGANVSNAQREVTELVESFGVRVERENRTVLGGLHIDTWVPERNLGIEYHGSFWHLEEAVGNKHREKWERAERAGVRLIQLFDWEWLGRRSAVEERLKAMFGATKALGARNCTRREVSRSEANAFFDEVHTQGRGKNPDVAYGLFSGDTMVACMSFGLARYKAEGQELMRYATRGRVHGAFTSLLGEFVDQRGPDEIHSYCDLRWGNGSVYRQAGFDLLKITPPDYWYYHSESRPRITRYEVQNKRDKSMTENEWVAAQGYRKVLGVGQQHWIWRKPT